jgi:hypothetical protein
MNLDPVEDVPDTTKTGVGIFQGDAAHDPVHLVVLLEKELSQVRPVLPGDAGDQCDTFTQGSDLV